MCGFDLETNSAADHSKNIGVYNNLFDYEDAGLESAGNAYACKILIRDQTTAKLQPQTMSRSEVAVTFDHRYMSNGIFLVGLKQCEIVNNYVFRTGQNALQAYAWTDA